VRSVKSVKRLRANNLVLQSPAPERIKSLMVHDEQDTDESLMERVKRGDHQAFAVLVRRCSQMFYAAAYRMCGDAQEAEDIVQEAFLKLWRSPHAFDGKRGAKFSTWFYRVVTNMAIDQVRKRKWQGGAELLERLTDGAAAVDHVMVEQERHSSLEKAIQNLPHRQRAALNLCVYEELSNKEAAEVLGVGVKALESLLMRAKAKLKNDMKGRKGV
jgi:RNA polymerase sigma-70 factor (ECF subfamily)